MFQRLQQKWKVNGFQLVLILCTFAIGGSLTGLAGKKLMNLFTIEQRWVWLVSYILVVTILWPFAVLIISVFFGQYRFFISYLTKMGRRMKLVKDITDGRLKMTGNEYEATENKQQKTNTLLTATNSQLLTHPLTRIAIFASGAGSNAQMIVDHFKNLYPIKVALLVCNNPLAGVLTIAAKENIPSIIIDKEKFFRGNGYTDELKEYKIGFVVLAGFLWKIPDTLIKTYPGKIINIHPALLPKHGGKGMYGNKVHEAVIAAREKETGITIHYVDGQYDNGDIIFQARCPVLENDTAVSLSKRVHQLEHEYYPAVIEKLLTKG